MHLLEALDDDFPSVGFFGFMRRNKPDLSPRLPSSAVFKLHSTGPQYQRSHFTDDGSQYDKILVGVAIFQLPSGIDASDSNPNPKLLVAQADTAIATERSDFGLPCGEVKPKDESVACALARVVKEETGLRVVRVVGSLPDFAYCVDEPKSLANGETIAIQKSVRQLNFVAEVESEPLESEMEARPELLWLSEQEIGTSNTTNYSRRVMEDAFSWTRRDRFDYHQPPYLPASFKQKL